MLHTDLSAFIRALVNKKLIECDEDAIEDFSRQTQIATFLNRDEGGNFAFIHNSFGEYFLARKIFDCIAAAAGQASLREALGARRLDRKVIHFLTKIDEEDLVREPLAAVLRDQYSSGVSENALEILYWTQRIRLDMETEIPDHARLLESMKARIPEGANLAGAHLQGALLESAYLANADLGGADLTGANLSHSLISGASFRGAKLAGARVEQAVSQRAGFSAADLTGASFTGADLEGSRFDSAVVDAAVFLSARLKGARGLAVVTQPGRRVLKASIQLGSASAVNCVAYGPGGETIATGDQAGVIRLYRTRDGVLLRAREGHAGAVNSIAFSEDGEHLASGSDDNSVRLWEVKTGKTVRVMEGHQSGVSSVAFSEDGEHLASGGHDKSVRLWEVKTGKTLYVLEGHLGPVYSVAFAPNGRYLIAAGSAGRLQFWDLKTGETFLYRYSFAPGAWLDLLLDGRFDGSPEGMRFLRYTELGTLNSYAAEDLVKEFYDPAGVAEVLARYIR